MPPADPPSPYAPPASDRGGVGRCLAHLPALRRYARLLTGDGARADDLVQDTLERACARWARFVPRPSTADGGVGDTGDQGLRGWLMSLMHNLHLNQRRDARHDDEALGLDDVPEPAHEPTRGTGERLDLERALQRLSPPMREVLLLVSVEEYSYGETAALLGVPIGTVMSRLHRAREQLRLWLEPEAPDASPAPLLTIVKR